MWKTGSRIPTSYPTIRTLGSDLRSDLSIFSYFSTVTYRKTNNCKKRDRPRSTMVTAASDDDKKVLESAPNDVERGYDGDNLSVSKGDILQQEHVDPVLNAKNAPR